MPESTFPDRALVVPAPTGAELGVVAFSHRDQGHLVEQVRAAIGAEFLDTSSTIRTPLGEFRYWVADDSLQHATIAHNDRVLALVRVLGYDAPDIGGTVVLTGYVDQAGNHHGLTDQQWDTFSRLLAPNPDFPEQTYRRAQIEFVEGDDAVAELHRHLFGRS